MARVLFYLPLPPPDKKHYVPFHRGVGQIAAILKREGHQVFLRMPFNIPEREAASDIIHYKPDCIFLSLATPQSKALGPIAQAARAADIPLLVGGPHPSFAPHDVLAVPGVTAIARGEGEEAAPSFLSGHKNCPGLIFPGSGITTFGALADPAGLPLPDREIFSDSPDFIPERTIMGLELAASRGCPFHCRYCSNSGYLTAYGPRFLRRLPVDYVIQEAAAAMKHDKDATIAGFHDDVFISDLTWLKEFAEKSVA